MRGAEISAKNANFIVNRGGASAADVLGLLELTRERVQQPVRHRAWNPRSGSSVSRRGGLASPHGTAGALADLGRRSPLVARQRIGRAAARRRLRARARALAPDGSAVVTLVLARSAWGAPRGC